LSLSRLHLPCAAILIALCLRCHLERSLAGPLGQTESKDLRLLFGLVGVTAR